MIEWIHTVWTYMRPRALRASLRCNLRLSSVSLRTWSSAAQRSQLHTITHITTKNKTKQRKKPTKHKDLHGVTAGLYSYIITQVDDHEMLQQLTLLWLWAVTVTQSLSAYLLFQPLKWIRYFGILLPCSSVPIKTSRTCEVRTQQ